MDTPWIYAVHSKTKLPPFLHDRPFFTLTPKVHRNIHHKPRETLQKNAILNTIQLETQLGHGMWLQGFDPYNQVKKTLNWVIGCASE